MKNFQATDGDSVWSHEAALVTRDLSEDKLSWKMWYSVHGKNTRLHNLKYLEFDVSLRHFDSKIVFQLQIQPGEMTVSAQTYLPSF